MQAAAKGRGNLGIPLAVAKHYVSADRKKAKKRKGCGHK